MPLDGKLLIATGRQTLSGVPRFGDLEQIKARKFLERAQEHFEHMRECVECRNWELCAAGWNVSDEVQAAAWAFYLGERIA